MSSPVLKDPIETEGMQEFDPALPKRNSIGTLVIGCGNLLRGDDAVGPVLIRRLWDHGLPDDVQCADGGTGGMDVAFQMRGVAHAVLVDACSSGSEPGTIFELPGEEVEQLPPLSGIHLHAFRWDHALAFGRWLLKEDYPKKITVYLIEGERFEVGEGLTSNVDKAIDRLKDRLLAQWSMPKNKASHRAASERVELTADGYLRLSKETSERFFPEHSLVALWREGDLYLLPTRGAAAGGLVLKQRNPSGDRACCCRRFFSSKSPAVFLKRFGMIELVE